MPDFNVSTIVTRPGFFQRLLGKQPETLLDGISVAEVMDKAQGDLPKLNSKDFWGYGKDGQAVLATLKNNGKADVFLQPQHATLDTPVYHFQGDSINLSAASADAPRTHLGEVKDVNGQIAAKGWVVYADDANGNVVTRDPVSSYGERLAYDYQHGDM